MLRMGKACIAHTSPNTQRHETKGKRKNCHLAYVLSVSKQNDFIELSLKADLSNRQGWKMEIFPIIFAEDLKHVFSCFPVI